jgi:hypothetical protein
LFIGINPGLIPYLLRFREVNCEIDRSTQGIPQIP